MRLAWTLVALLLVAGCTAPSAAPPVKPAQPVTDDHRASDLVATITWGIAEPSLAVTPDDNVTIVAVSGPVHAWHGRAAGGSIVDVTAPEGAGDTNLVQNGGVLYHLGLASNASRVPYQSSSDGGLTWTKEKDLSADSGNGLVDRIWIGAGHGRLAATWGRTAVGPMVEASISDDGGATWSTPTVIAQPDNSFGKLAVDPTSGRVYAPWGDEAGRLHAAVSDDGKTWSDHIIAAAWSYSFPAMAVDAKGTVFAVWSAALDGRSPIPRAQGGTNGVFLPSVPTMPYFAASLDHGITWSQPLMLAASGTSGWYPTIQAGDPGHVVVAWYEAPFGGADGKGKLALAVSNNADSAAPSFTRHDPTPQPVPIGISCPDSTRCTSKRTVGEALEVALRPNGAPAVAWVQEAADGVEIHYASPSLDPLPES